VIILFHRLSDFCNAGIVIITGLIAGGADMNLQEETTGMSALMATIQNNHKAVAQFLIAIQLIRDCCDINLVDKSGKTALMHAIELGTS
jgi:ankyrin repeat protein